MIFYLPEIATNCRNWANFVFIEAQAKQKALRTISELASFFYSITIWSDEESKSDATEVLLQEMTVDDLWRHCWLNGVWTGKGSLNLGRNGRGMRAVEERRRRPKEVGERKQISQGWSLFELGNEDLGVEI